MFLKIFQLPYLTQAQIASAGRLVVQQSVSNSKLVDVSIDYGYAEPLKLATKTLDAGVRSNFLEKATVTTNTTEPSLRIPKGSEGFSITIQPSLTETAIAAAFYGAAQSSSWNGARSRVCDKPCERDYSRAER